jgi:hypothetical protein
MCAEVNMATDLCSDHLSAGQAGHELRLSVPRIRQLLAEGVLPVSYVTPLGKLIPRDAVEALRREREARNNEVAGEDQSPATQEQGVAAACSA